MNRVIVASHGLQAKGNNALLLVIVWVLASVMIVREEGVFVEAADHIVGGFNGWKADYDYASWVDVQTFEQGDTITFNYDPTKYNVVEATRSDYEECKGGFDKYTSGHDVIALNEWGVDRYFFCNIDDHCTNRSMAFSFYTTYASSNEDTTTTNTTTDSMPPSSNTTPSSKTTNSSSGATNSSSNTATRLVFACPLLSYILIALLATFLLFPSTKYF